MDKVQLRRIPILFSRQRLSIGQRRQAWKFGRDLVWTTGASLVVKLQGVLLIILLGRAAGVEWYGAWTLTFAVASYLTLLASLMLPNAMVRFFPEESEKSTPSLFLFFLSVVCVLSFGISFAAMLFADRFALVFLKSQIFKEFVLWGTLLIPMNSVVDMLQNYYRAHDDLKTFSLLSGGVPVLQLIGVSIVLIFLSNPLLALQALLVTGFGVELILVLGILKMADLSSIYTIVNGRRLKRYLKYSLPLVPSGFSAQISSNGDRFVVGYFLGAQYVGMYAAAYALASLLMLFNPPITNVLFPKVSKYYTNRNFSAVRKYMNAGMALYCSIGILLTSSFVFVGNDLLKLLLKDTQEIVDQNSLLIVTLIVSFSLIIYGVARIYSLYILILEKTTIWFLVYMFSAVGNVVLNFVLIPPYGLVGAAVSTLVTYSMIALFIVFYVNKISLSLLAIVRR